MAEKQQVSKTKTWWEGVKAEFRKIIWPTQEDLAKKFREDFGESL